MSARARRALTVLCACTALVCSSAGAAPESNQQLFEEGVKALQAGDHDKAIATFEALADRGETSPSASYDRGLAYLARVRGKAERPGDLGQAAAAFDETLLADPDDVDAQHAAELVRAEVARRRVRHDAPAEVQARPSLDRIVIGLAPEPFWEWGAIVSSLVLTAGLILRKAPRGPRHLAGLIATPIGLVCLLAFGALSAQARHIRRTTLPAVIVAPEAQMLDDNGAATGRDPVPEAARVELHEQRGSLVLIQYGGEEGWTHAASVRRLAASAESF